MWRNLGLPPLEPSPEDVDVDNAFDPERLGDLARIEAWRAAQVLAARDASAGAAWTKPPRRIKAGTRTWRMTGLPWVT